MNTLTISIQEFCAAHLGESFSPKKLHDYVSLHHINVAPETPSRILRKLRSKGIVSYHVPNRKTGEYLVTAVS